MNFFSKKGLLDRVKISFFRLPVPGQDLFKVVRTEQISYKFKNNISSDDFYSRSFRKKKYSQRHPLNLRTYRRVKSHSEFKYLLTLKVCANNIFCNLSYPAFQSHNQTLLSISSGKLNVKVSKKRLKPMLKLYLISLLKKVKSAVKSKILLVEIKAPRKLRKKIGKNFSKLLMKHFSLLFDFKHLKSFNGCRPKKFRRKKRKRLVIYK